MGRPPAYDDPKKMQKVIDDYFASCKGRIFKDKNGKEVYDKRGNLIIIDEKPLTVSGLCHALGFSSRNTLCEYGKREGFADIVSRAKLRIEQYAEERLYDKDGNRGAEFVLRCNFGWKDNSTEEQGNGILDELLGYLKKINE